RRGLPGGSGAHAFRPGSGVLTRGQAGEFPAVSARRSQYHQRLSPKKAGKFAGRFPPLWAVRYCACSFSLGESGQSPRRGRKCVARPAEEVMSPEPGAAFGKGGQHYTTDCPISRIGTAGREPSRNPRAERQRRTTLLPGAVNKWVRLLTLRSPTFLESALGA